MSFRSLALLVVVVGVAAIAVRPAFDSDTGWHLRAGEWIVANGRVPTVDVFSHTAVGEPWRYPGWLADVLLLGAFRAGGLAGLTVLMAAVVGISLTLVWRLLDGPLLLRAAVLLLAAATAAVYWAARPHILTFALAAVFLYVLERHRRGRRSLELWLLPIGMAVWVNVHGGFIVGYILLLMFLAGSIFELLAALLTGRETWEGAWSDRRREIVSLGAVFGLCLVAAALNPHGPAILAYPFRTVAIPVLQDRIEEWQSPDFHDPRLYPFLAMLVGLLVAFGASRRRGGATELILSAGWAAMALLAVRNVAIFAAAAAPALARQAAVALEPVLPARPDEEQPGPRRRILHIVAASVLLVGLGAWLVVQLSPSRNRAHLEAIAPVAAVEALMELRPTGPIFNDYNWGGYLLWAAGEAYPTFVDGRTDVFPPDIFEDYLRLWSAQDGWQTAMDEYGIRVVLLPPQAPLVAALSDSGWAEVFRDETAVVLTVKVP